MGEVAGRLEEALNDATYRTWFARGRRGRARRTTRSSSPSRTTSRASGSRATSRADRRRGPRRDRPGTAGSASPSSSDRRRPRRSREPEPPAEARRDRPQSEVHVRPLRDRLVQPLRPRRRARGRGGAGAGLQPAVHLRRHRASGRRTCSRRSRSTSPSIRASSPLRYVTSETFMNDFINSLRDKRIEGFKQRYRTYDVLLDRRHPVLRAQGADPGGVLPHLQLALRGRAGRSSSPRTARRATSRRSRSGCARGSSGG